MKKWNEYKAKDIQAAGEYPVLLATLLALRSAVDSLEGVGEELLEYSKLVGSKSSGLSPIEQAETDLTVTFSILSHNTLCMLLLGVLPVARSADLERMFDEAMSKKEGNN